MLKAKIEITAENPVELAIKAVGDGAELGRLLGVHRQQIHYWKLKGWWPESRIKEVSRVTGIPVETLRTRD